MEEAEEIKDQAFKDTMASFTIYSPEQKKKYQEFLMNPPQNGQDLMNDYNTAHRSRMNAKPAQGQKNDTVIKKNDKQLGAPNN